VKALPGVGPGAVPAPEEQPHRRQRQQLLRKMVGELQVIGGYAGFLTDLPREDPRRREGEKILSEVTALHRFIAETVL
jgi:hypothetical protein